MSTKEEDGRMVAVLSAITILLMGREIARDPTAREAMSRQFDAANYAIGVEASQRELGEIIVEGRSNFQNLLSAAQAVADKLTDQRPKRWRQWLDRLTRPN
jgi:hypothetical protein